MVGPTVQSKPTISNKIVGRDDEIEELQDIYRQLRDENGPFARDEPSGSKKPTKNAKAVYVKGLSGTGKSRLVLEALQKIVESDGGYFCQGKFDQNRSLRPFSALADALSDLCSAAYKHLEDDDDARRKLEQLSSKKETDWTVVAMIPNMKHCLPKAQPKTCKDNSQLEHSQAFSVADASTSGSSIFGAEKQQLSATSAIQFKMTFRKLVKALMGEKILVMFIDDLQSADIDSVDLMDELITNMPFRRFLLIGGFRSDEVKEGQYFSNFLGEAVKASIPASIISVRQLKLEDITMFVADTLSFNDMDHVKPLAELVHDKTHGNIFYVRQYIDFLYQNGHIFYSQQQFRWEWEELATIKDATAGESSISAVVSKKILKLPRDTVDSLKLAACIGGRFDLDVIEHVAKQWWKDNSESDPSSVDAIMMDDVLWSAVEEGLLEEVCADPMSFTASLQYKFTHDKVQAASFGLIGEDATKRYHLAVGTYLLQLSTEFEDRKWLLVMAADHLYKAESIIVSQTDRDEYAAVNLQAATELESNAAFKSSTVYCQNAIHLLGENAFERNYELSLQVYNMSAKMESCSGFKSASDQRIDKIIDHARCLDDKHTGYYIRIRSCHQLNEFNEGITIAYGLLRQMKVTRLPKKVRPVHIVYEMFSVFRAVKRLSTEELLNMPTTENQTVSRYTMFLMQGVLCCLTSEPIMLAFLTLRAVKVSLRFGYSTFTPSFFAVCAFLRLAITGNSKEADRIGCVGLRLAERFNAPQADVITKYMYGAGVSWVVMPMTNAAKIAKEIHTIGFNCGDSGWGCVGGGGFIVAAFLDSSVRLDKLASMAAFYQNEMQVYDQLTVYEPTRVWRQAALNLLGRSKDANRLEGDEIKNWESFEAALQTALCRRHVALAQMILSHYFFDLDNAERLVKLSMKVWKDDYPFFAAVIGRVHQCMLLASLYERDKAPKFKKLFRTTYATVLGWRKSGSPNGAVFCCLLEAVKQSTFDKCSHDEVRVAYEEAIRKTADFGLRCFSTMAAERAGMYFASIQGQEKLAASFLETAIEGYQEWRATGKVRDVYERHGMLLGRHRSSANDSVISEDYYGRDGGFKYGC